MSGDLVRFGLAMEEELVTDLDRLATSRGCTRSELLRDLVRTELSRSSSQQRVPAVAAVTLIYNHHVRQLSERLTSIQHSLGESVRSTMHVHLDADNCLEMIVLRGRSDALRAAAEQMLATRGVSHGSVEMVTEKALKGSRTHRRGEKGEKGERGREKGRVHVDAHAHAHAHAHDHDHDDEHGLGLGLGLGLGKRGARKK